MKKLMILGALMGFVIGIGFGLSAEGADWPAVLVRASFAAFASGMLMRWWGRVWVKSLRQSYIERITAAIPSKHAAVQTAPAKPRV